MWVCDRDPVEVFPWNSTSPLLPPTKTRSELLPAFW